jgi:two-component system, response regulator YesN
VKYVSQLFKKKTGENLIHYLHKVRITKAQWYLLHSKLTVNDIALKVGFENGNYFIKIFKRFSNGVTPYQYRKDGTPSE